MIIFISNLNDTTSKRSTFLFLTENSLHFSRLLSISKQKFLHMKSKDRNRGDRPIKISQHLAQRLSFEHKCQTSKFNSLIQLSNYSTIQLFNYSSFQLFNFNIE